MIGKYGAGGGGIGGGGGDVDRAGGDGFIMSRLDRRS